MPVELDVTSAGRVARAGQEANDVDLLVSNAGSLESFDVLASDASAVPRDFDERSGCARAAVCGARVTQPCAAPAGTDGMEVQVR